MAAEQIIANLVMQVEAQTKGVERVAKIVEDFSKNIQGIVQPLQAMTKSFDNATRQMVAVAQKNFGQVEKVIDDTKKKVNKDKILNVKDVLKDTEGLAGDIVQGLSSGINSKLDKAKINLTKLGGKEAQRQINAYVRDLTKALGAIEGTPFGEIDISDALTKSLNLTQEQQKAIQSLFNRTKELGEERRRARDLEGQQKRLDGLRKQLEIQQELAKVEKNAMRVSGSAGNIAARGAVEAQRAQKAGLTGLSAGYLQVARDANVLKTSMEGVVKTHENSTRSIRRQTKGFNDAAESGDSFRKSMENVTKSTQLALGPLSGVAARITALTGLLKGNAVAIGVSFAALTGLVVGWSSAVTQGSLFEQQLLRIEGVLEATGNPFQFTTEELDRMAKGLAEATLTSTSFAREAVASLLTFRNVGRDAFEQVLFAAQGLSALNKTGLLENVRRLGKVLQDPVKNLGALSEAGVQFSRSQQAAIKRLAETGRLVEAQQLVLEGLGAQIKAASAEAGGFAGALDTMVERLGFFFESLNSALGITESFGQVVNSVSESVKSLTAFIEANKDSSLIFIGLKKLIEGLAASFSFLIENVRTFTSVLVLAGVGSLAQSFFSAIAAARSFADAVAVAKFNIGALAGFALRFLPGVGAVIGGIVGAVIAFGTKTQQTMNELRQEFFRVEKTATAVIGRIREDLENLGGVSPGTSTEAIQEIEVLTATLKAEIKEVKALTRDIDRFGESMAMVTVDIEPLTREMQSLIMQFNNTRAGVISFADNFEDLNKAIREGDFARIEELLPPSSVLSQWSRQLSIVHAKLREMAADKSADSTTLAFKNLQEEVQVVLELITQITTLSGKAETIADLVGNAAEKGKTNIESLTQSVLSLFKSVNEEVAKTLEYDTALAKIRSALDNIKPVLASLRQHFIDSGLNPESAESFVKTIEQGLRDLAQGDKLRIKILDLEDEKRELDKLTDFISGGAGTAGEFVDKLRGELFKLKSAAELSTAEFDRLLEQEKIDGAKVKARELVGEIVNLERVLKLGTGQSRALFEHLKATFPNITQGARDLEAVYVRLLTRLEETGPAIERQREATREFERLIMVTEDVDTSLQQLLTTNERNLKVFSLYRNEGKNFEQALTAFERTEAVEQARKLAQRIEELATTKNKIEEVGRTLDKLKMRFPVLLMNVNDLEIALVKIAGAGFDAGKELEKAADKTDKRFQALREAFQGVGQSLLSTIDEFVDTGIFKIQEFINAILKEFLRLLAIRAIVDPLFSPEGGIVSGFVENVLKGGSAAGSTATVTGSGIQPGLAPTKPGTFDPGILQASPATASAVLSRGTVAGQPEVPMEVTVVDQRTSGPLPQISRGVGADGRQQLRVIIRDELGSALSDGSQDSTLGINYGVTRKAIRR